MSDGDRVGRSAAEGQSTGGLIEKANLSHPSDEAGEASKGSDRLGDGVQKQVATTGK